MTTESAVRTALGLVQDPHCEQDLISSGAVRGVGVDGSKVAVEIQLGYPAAGWHATLEALVRQALEALPEVEQATVTVTSRVHAHRVQKDLTPLPEVRNIIAVASGKGGVGKSTTAVNLALALQAEGATVGVLDADIYGPSIPKMLGLSGRPDSPDGKTIEPKRNHGLQAMSIGLLVAEDTPMIWRGPMVTQALQQLLNDTRWQGLDYLVIDLPPGTGDIQLTLAQRVPVSGAVIVTTPQDIATLDARKALQMFAKVDVPVLGIVENMAVHVCSNCGHSEHVFGAGGGQKMAAQYDVPLLGSLPLDIHIREQADSGTPTVAADPGSALSLAYRDIARRTAARLSVQARNKAIAFPNIVMQNT
ncbi:MAG: iron-sulfur cluster carrier protein ApbC [Arenimonas sp.]|uniref:iron-sulfur cluster carrier protein ApbC n=1 Tax=Arenimonas sp. TaxID=1872635 RepID=UPI0025C68FD4|nr:iron-sulfur cluster carrier protein ApbC [Arenimonas sp.]MBW8367112.1 iron-sulfur cluster carrier protein ApbC [Arenimonas sp.]